MWFNVNNSSVAKYRNRPGIGQFQNKLRISVLDQLVKSGISASLRNSTYKECFGRLNIGGCHTHAYIYLCKNIIGGLNIGNFIQKSPIAKIYSSPIFHLMQY